MQTLSQKKIALISLITIAVIVLIGVGVFALRQSPSNGREAEIEQGLAQMNKTLPKMIDSITRLDTVTTSDGSDVIYHYTVMGAAAQKVTSADLQPMKAQVSSAYCSNKQLNMFRRNDMVLKYRYYREDASFVGELDATVRDCPAAAAK